MRVLQTDTPSKLTLIRVRDRTNTTRTVPCARTTVHCVRYRERTHRPAAPRNLAAFLPIGTDRYPSGAACGGILYPRCDALRPVRHKHAVGTESLSYNPQHDVPVGDFVPESAQPVGMRTLGDVPHIRHPSSPPPHVQLPESISLGPNGRSQRARPAL